MTPYFRRSMSPMERHGCRGRGEILSPKTHGHVLLRESRFQERVLGDQWDTYPRLEALCQSNSEKRGFSRDNPSSAEGAIYRRKNGAVERKNLQTPPRKSTARTLKLGR